MRTKVRYVHRGVERVMSVPLSRDFAYDIRRRFRSDVLHPDACSSAAIRWVKGTMGPLLATIERADLLRIALMCARENVRIG